MSEELLESCVARHLAHAAWVSRLDDELGVHHGLSWSDFVLLAVLDAGRVAPLTTELARSLCVPPSRLVQQLLPLEKTGLLERVVGCENKRQVALSPHGRRLLREARRTAVDSGLL